MWSFWICDTQTGVKQLRMWPSASRATRKLNGAGTGSHTFQLRRDGLTRAQHQDLFSEWRRTIVVCWNGRPVYAGLITGSDYSTETGAITVDTAELRTILTRRFPFGIGTYVGGTLIIPNRSLRGLVYQLVFYGTQGARSPVWNLPIIAPTWDEAGDQSRNYFNYEFHTIEAAISELQDVEGGPDIDFAPRWSSTGTLEWELRVGSAAVPRLGGPAFEFNITAAKSGTFNVRLRSNGSKMVTGVFTVGKGSEADMRHGEDATLAVAGGIPSLDVTRQMKDQDDVGILDAHSRSEVATYKAPTKQLSFSVSAADVMDTALPGSTYRLYFKGDEMIDDGWQLMWSLGYSIDLSRNVTIDVQEA